MQGDAKVIELLNEVLTNELTAINQYFLHAKMQTNWGYQRLGAHTEHESIDEMKHADELVERILYLDGLPNLQRLHSLRIGETVPEQLELDLAHEVESMAVLRRGIDLCRGGGDVGSALLLEKILASEEEHIDWLETQLELIRQLGAAEYLSLQVHSDD